MGVLPLNSRPSSFLGLVCVCAPRYPHTMRPQTHEEDGSKMGAMSELSALDCPPAVFDHLFTVEK
jgi:hypothetical protein